MEDTPRAEFARGEHKPVASAAKARSRDELAHPAGDCRSSVSGSGSLSLERDCVGDAQSDQPRDAAGWHARGRGGLRQAAQAERAGNETGIDASSSRLPPAASVAARGGRAGRGSCARPRLIREGRAPAGESVTSLGNSHGLPFLLFHKKNVAVSEIHTTHTAVQYVWPNPRPLTRLPAFVALRAMLLLEYTRAYVCSYCSTYVSREVS